MVNHKLERLRLPFPYAKYLTDKSKDNSKDTIRLVVADPQPLPSAKSAMARWFTTLLPQSLLQSFQQLPELLSHLALQLRSFRVVSLRDLSLKLLLLAPDQFRNRLRLLLLKLQLVVLSDC